MIIIMMIIIIKIIIIIIIIVIIIIRTTTKTTTTTTTTITKTTTTTIIIILILIIIPCLIYCCSLSVTIPEGCMVAVVGQVGCGKSSLISAILGEMQLNGGSMNVKVSCICFVMFALILTQ